MKWLFKWPLRLLYLLVLLVILVLIFRDSILRAVVEHRIHERTGMDVKIGKLSSSLFSQEYTLENVRVYNPPEFGGTPFLNVTELHFELDTTELGQRNVRVTLARLNLAELDVVRGESGRTNVFVIFDKVKLRARKAGGWQKLFGDFHFTGIDVLNLSLGDCKYVDLSDTRNNHEYFLNLHDLVFRNVKSSADFHGILATLWLSSGGHFPIRALSVAEVVNKIETRIQRQVERATVPPQN